MSLRQDSDVGMEDRINMGGRAMVAAAFLASAIVAVGFLGRFLEPGQLGPAAAMLLLAMGAILFALAPRAPGEVAAEELAPDNVKEFPLPQLRSETMEVE